VRFQSLSSVVLCLVLGFVLASAPSSLSQGTNTVLQNPPLDQKPNRADDQRLKMERDMAKRANLARQADLKRDTDKLVKLTTELKDYVDKTNEGVLSVDVVKKAEEIEKLAHSVKDKMKGGY